MMIDYEIVEAAVEKLKKEEKQKLLLALVR